MICHGAQKLGFILDNLIDEILYAVLISGIVFIGLWLSNIVYDFGVPQYLSRKIGHFAGGLAFLISALVFSSSWWPIILATFFGTLLVIARVLKPETFRGVGGSGRNKKVMAEVWFAWVAVPVCGISWLWLNKPLVAASCLVFMAWGDGITGLVRWYVYHRPVKGLWGSLAMLCVCLIISWMLLEPIWIGFIGSIAAVITEWAFGENGFFKWADDNWAIPLISLGTVLGIMAVTGNI